MWGKRLEREGKTKEDDAPVYTYFINIAGNEIKIGKSADPVRRCDPLAHQIPTRPHLLYYTARVTEAEAHQRFCDLRLHSEWFKNSGTTRIC